MRAIDKTKEQIVGELEAMRLRVAELEKLNAERKQAERNTWESGASLAEAQRIAHLGNWDWDIKSNALRWSDEIYRIFGLEPQEFGATYEAFLNSVHPDDREFVQKSVNEALYEAKPYGMEHRIVLPDGLVRIVHEQGEVAFDKSGKPIRMIGTVHDITEHKQAEELSKDLFTSSAIGAYIVQDGKFQLVNPYLQKLLGYNEDELLGVYSLRFALPEDRDMVRENAVKMLKGERSSPYEYRIVSKGGKVRWVVETVTSIQHRGGRVTLGSCMDITESKRAEKALEMQKELTDRILDSTPSAVLVIGGDLEIVLANKAFYETFRVKRREARNRHIADVLPLEGLSEAISKTLADGESRLNLEFRYGLDGGERILVAQMMPMQGGGEEEVLLILRDVTIERATQEQLYHIGRLAAIGELASGVAHELNNPLTGVVGYSELVLDADIPQEVKEDVEIIHRNAQRAASIVKNLLTFARRQRLEKQYLNVNDLIKHVVEIRRYELMVGNIEVVTELADELPEVMADSQQLEQVFLNVILNAAQAMIEVHGRGTLTIKAEARGAMIRIAFTDDGPGIPQENLSRVFDPFFTTKEVGKGTGLGLSICHGIITEHGGRIYAESKTGEGAAFFVELPM